MFTLLLGIENDCLTSHLKNEFIIKIDKTNVQHLDNITSVGYYYIQIIVC